MITVIPGRTAGSSWECTATLEFKADRNYDVYALEGNGQYLDSARISLRHSSGSSYVTLKEGEIYGVQGVASYKPVSWSGHLVLLNGDSLIMQVEKADSIGPVELKISLVPLAVMKKAEKEAEKEWLP
ncbi:unnamed protein product [marine sediment metagenome]|uniref:Uncharacterized protein n=1 Tax=marine sediment metagenome TaxID=412755 RepID=X1JDY1_9ZZZZ